MTLLQELSEAVEALALAEHRAGKFKTGGSRDDVSGARLRVRDLTRRLRARIKALEELERKAQASASAELDV